MASPRCISYPWIILLALLLACVLQPSAESTVLRFREISRQYLFKNPTHGDTRPSKMDQAHAPLIPRANNSTRGNCVTNCPFPKCSPCPTGERCIFVVATCTECSRAICHPETEQVSGEKNDSGIEAAVIGGVIGGLLLATLIYALMRYRKCKRAGVPFLPWGKKTPKERTTLATKQVSAAKNPSHKGSTSAIIPIAYVPHSARSSMVSLIRQDELEEGHVTTPSMYPIGYLSKGDPEADPNYLHPYDLPSPPSPLSPTFRSMTTLPLIQGQSDLDRSNPTKAKRPDGSARHQNMGLLSPTQPWLGQDIFPESRDSGMLEGVLAAMHQPTEDNSGRTSSISGGSPHRLSRNTVISEVNGEMITIVWNNA
ncbi:uncharacterized protein VTP21DRAFT_976 [Calcarisporiella thermophila]|uniref:uncharacterized protein n=1 Tax=Calcarisporiella thermophila TaxID=911321 RepID=UPI0037434E7E